MSLFYADTDEVLTNRKNFLNSLGIDYRDLVCAKQIHASFVRYVGKEDKGKGALSYQDAIADTDALISDKRNLPLAVFTADCLPIFLYDPQRPAIGLTHAGWQGSRQNIVACAVKLMQEKFDTKPGDLFVGLGPAIRDCCYEVGREFSGYFTSGLIQRSGRYYLDLPGINRQQLLGLGVKTSRIFDSGTCTSCQNADFFSYRRQGKACGRMMSVIMLK